MNAKDDDESELFRRAMQDQIVIETIQPGALSGLEIDAGLPTQCRINNDSLQIIVGLETNTHRGPASSWRAFCNRA